MATFGSTCSGLLSCNAPPQLTHLSPPCSLLGTVGGQKSGPCPTSQHQSSESCSRALSKAAHLTGSGDSVVYCRSAGNMLTVRSRVTSAGASGSTLSTTVTHPLGLSASTWFPCRSQHLLIHRSAWVVSMARAARPARDGARVRSDSTLTASGTRAASSSSTTESRYPLDPHSRSPHTPRLHILHPSPTTLAPHTPSASFSAFAPLRGAGRHP